MPRGGKRAGSGRPKFVPNDQQRALVKMCYGTGTYTQEEIAAVIKHPDGKSISVDTLVKAFAAEIEVARMELRVQLDSNLISHAKKGSLGHQIWFEKTRLRIRDPSDEPKVSVDAANATVRHVVEYRGGLPEGSTPENPAGNAPDIPPEESHK